MDKYKMEGITEEKIKQRTLRTKEVHYENAPSITSITAEERILPYVDRYYFFVNGERVPADISQPEVKQVIYEFYKEHFPGYLKEGLPEILTEEDNILDCFEVFNMPDYRPKHAFPGLITLEDLRNGLIHDEDKPKYAFPGLELLGARKKMDEEGAGKPAYADLGGYTAFDGDREGAKNKIEEMKKQFASQIEALNVNHIDIDAVAKEKVEEEIQAEPDAPEPDNAE
ncbi:MAG: hypothetical protein IJ137_11570 [Eubacterium sp.]|nr:hypothetical protein [Eubacterium sp.]